MMCQLLRSLLLGLSLFGVGARLLAAQPALVAAEANPRLLIIAIDGLRPDYVLDADRHGLRVPTLRSFVRDGTYATGVQGVFPSVTYPSFTTILTGVSPATHGIVGNTTFDPLQQNSSGWYWYAEDVRVPTLWDVAAEAGLSTGNVHWPVSVGANVRWNLPQIWRSGTPDDRKLLRSLATPELQAELEAHLRVEYADGIDESIAGDENRARFAVELLEQKRPAVMTAYFTALDHEQHATGPYTAEDYAVLERIDAIVGSLVATAKRLSGGQVTIAVISDHGFEATTQDVNPLVAFREAGLVTFTEGSERPTDWRAAVWPNGASFAVVLKDPADDATRVEVDGLLRRLGADPANGLDRVLSQEELRAYGAYTPAHFAVSLRPGYQLGARTSGPLVTPRPGRGGMHGYLPHNPNMNASFFLIGPQIRRGASLGMIDMKDIAPTLASLLELTMPKAEGRILDVSQ